MRHESFSEKHVCTDVGINQSSFGQALFETCCIHSQSDGLTRTEKTSIALGLGKTCRIIWSGTRKHLQNKPMEIG